MKNNELIRKIKVGRSNCCRKFKPGFLVTALSCIHSIYRAMSVPFNILIQTAEN